MGTLPHIVYEILDIFHKASFFALSLQAALVILVIWLILHKNKSNEKSRNLSAEQKAALIANWTPEPLVGDTPLDHPALSPRLVTGRVGKRITVDGRDCLNLGTHNYLGLLEDEDIQEDAIRSLKKYGVGSCGPRGFYGTVDVHLDLEEKLAQFMDMEEAVVYSYGFSTIASAIPAYAKRTDICFVDEAANFAIQKGLDASRCTVVYFRHNDMKDLEEKLLEQSAKDVENPKKAAKTRKFLIAEGIYMNTGEMCPLAELVEMRKKYRLRFFLDESITFGTMGATGRGLTEHLGVDKDEIDLISASLEWAVGTIGGFCVGSSFIVDHQRLSGLGYCFSASCPPLLTQAALSALDKFNKHPELFAEIQESSRRMQKKLENLSMLALRGNPISPVKHLYIRQEKSSKAEVTLLTDIVEKCISRGLCLVNAQYLAHIEKKCPRASIRLTVNRLLTDEDMAFAFETLESVSKEILA
ncbi:serine palmitoyltransferase 1 [Phlebotomus argentipes]|uniref:serine palmitoyltransferase 1 n=1 Tax=Phlebotomus argentipes TaxID=94469 RepID=UPI00289301C5|nr:serine palmitoyltransferase 1 [Phlebotomus argentipes]